MASTGKDTGHGGTIAFSAGITAFAAPFRKIGAVEQEIEKVDATTLGNAACKSYLPGDIPDPGEFEVEYAFEATMDHPDVLTPGTIVITAPTAPGQASAANLTGSGFIMARTATPELTTNGLQVGKLKCRFDGKNSHGAGLKGPVLTVAVDT
jgi:hypothetical protein